MNIVYLILSALVILLFAAWLIRRGRAEYADVKEKLRSINELSMSQAREQAVVLLGLEKLFVVSKSEIVGGGALSGHFPQSIIEMQLRCTTIRSAGAPFIDLDLSAIQESSMKEGFFRLGKGMESSDTEYELCFLPNEDSIYEVFADGEIDQEFGKYASIYHLIIAVAQEESLVSSRRG
jgi:hypothetical protein